MQFTVLEAGETPPPDVQGAFLIQDIWDDFGFRTNFFLEVRQDDGRLFHVGPVRIAHVDMELDETFSITADRMARTFTALPDGFFSLAHEADYYEALYMLPEGTAVMILKSLQDVAYTYGREVPDSLFIEAAFNRSLMRGTTTAEYMRMARTARGGARSLPFRWTYTPFPQGLLPPHRFDFRAEPGSLPPTNMHALIGRNGVGKSHLLHSIAEDATAGMLHVQSGTEDEEQVGLNGCVVVSFSPFDKRYQSGPEPVLDLVYIGLRHDRENRLKLDEELLAEFVDSFRRVRVGARGLRWQKAINTLNYTASGFLDGHQDVLTECIREESPQILRDQLRQVFVNLSSGHRVVLLTLTRLVEVVTERTLVLVDEPETHLHPPLLAALMRSISDLLTHQNGMAILATHSPVVLQEVPSTCVWKMQRNGDTVTAHRPTLETYGENVGELTHEAFGLEATSAGYYATIARLVDEGLPYQEIIGRFSGMGAEARSLLRALVHTRQGQN
ncbi:AAA family ATPase [Streptomyces sp. NPDC093801]|uniref:AAA family ATPase n=1 Tax=Streptomyces sp. NPDC093801 TaxID=3155203 RepID=UPI00344DD587